MAPQDFQPIIRALLPHAKAALSQLLLPAATTLLQAEDLLRAFLPQLGLALLQDFVDAAALPALEQRPLCAQGHPMHRSSCTPEDRRLQHTSLGELRIPDVRFYCRRCSQPQRPAHAALGGPPDTYSLPLCELAVDLASELSTVKAAATLQRQQQVKLHRSVLLRLLYRYGDLAREFLDSKLGAVLGDSPKTTSEEIAALFAALLEVQLDGSMVPVAVLQEIELEAGEEAELSPKRKQPRRHKECYYCEVRLGVALDPENKDRLYTARHREELSEVFRDLRSLTRLLGSGPDTHIHGIADGAPYIEQRMRKEFADQPFSFTLDRIHMREKLHEAEAALKKIKAKEGEGFVEWAMGKLREGLGEEVVSELRRIAGPRGRVKLKEVAGYIEKRLDQVDYGEVEAAGQSVSSSLAESGHRHVIQARLKISGAWWREENVGQVLALRVLKVNGWWDEFWAWCRKRWQDRAAKLRGGRAA